MSDEDYYSAIEGDKPQTLDERAKAINPDWPCIDRRVIGDMVVHTNREEDGHVTIRILDAPEYIRVSYELITKIPIVEGRLACRDNVENVVYFYSARELHEQYMVCQKTGTLHEEDC